MKIGDKVVWVSNSEFDDTTELREGIVTRFKYQDLVWVDHRHKLEECINWIYVWPAEARDELEAIFKERGKLRQQYLKSMGLVYQLANKYYEFRS